MQRLPMDMNTYSPTPTGYCSYSQSLQCSYRRAVKDRFTLTELLVVMSIVTTSAAMLLPAVLNSQRKARQIDCLSNVKQQVAGIHLYANDHTDFIPPNWATGYTGTSVVALHNGSAAQGLGLLIEDAQVPQAHIFGCRAASEPSYGGGEHSPDNVAAWWNGSKTFSPSPGTVPSAVAYRSNNVGGPVRIDQGLDATPALVMDLQVEDVTNYKHRGRWTNIGFRDGSVHGVHTQPIGQSGNTTVGPSNNADNIWLSADTSY